MKSFRWQLILALIAGLALGVLYSWILAPARYSDTSPDTLRADFKDQFRSSIAAAYAATDNLERARARLALLGDPNSIDALSAQAQRMLAAGDSFGSVQQVAQLAADLQAQPKIATAVTAHPTIAPTRLPAQGNLPAPTSTEASAIPGAFDTPGAISSPTARPTRTPTAAPGKPFTLIVQDTLCEPDLQEGLLQVMITDSRRRQLPGVEIVVAWDAGEEHFFTGFKPELGNGYADFVMQAGTVYNVRVAEGGPPVSGVTPPSCTSTDGSSFTGSIKLTFQQN